MLKKLASTIKNNRTYLLNFFYVLITVLFVQIGWGLYHQTLFSGDYLGSCLVFIIFYTISFVIVVAFRKKKH
jgi:hypothetical protein